MPELSMSLTCMAYADMVVCVVLLRVAMVLMSSVYVKSFVFVEKG